MAGWPTLKRARALLAAGSVQSASIDRAGKLTILKGMVAQGKKAYACGLLIHSKTDTENLCTCIESRRDGQICAHTVAVGLATIEGLRPPQAKPSAGLAPDQPIKSPTRWNIHIPRAFPDLWDKGTLPLRLTPTNGEGPAALASWLGASGVDPCGASATLLRLNHPQAAAFFRAASSYPDIHLEGSGKDPTPLRISEIPCRLPVEITYIGGGDGDVTLELHLERAPEIRLLRSESSIWIFQDTATPSLLPLPLPGGAAAIAELSDLFDGKPLKRPLDWLVGCLPLLHEAFHLSSPDGLLSKLDLTPASPTIQLELEGSLRHLTAKLTFAYPPAPVPGTGANLEQRLAAINATLRNPAAEQQATRRLQDAGFETGQASREFDLRGENQILGFYASSLPRLQSDPAWAITIGQRFQHVTRNIQRLRPQLESSGSGEDWFSFSVSYTTDRGQTLSAAEIRRLLDAGETSVARPGGSRIAIDRAALEDLREVLLDTNPEQSAGQYQVSAEQADYIRSTLGEAAESPAPECPATNISATLRPYQQDGVAWLFQRLGSRRGAGAILADEMGLGKTLQTLTLISAIPREAPALVICPTSLIHSWAAETEKFAPHLKVLVLHGSATQRRRASDKLGDFDLVLTSYGSLVRDLERHMEQEFSIVVLDEASYIKNPDTKNAKAARALAARARARLALTGTPIENSVRDLWSIMEFAIPGYLGSRDDFRQRYELPIGKSPADSSAEQSRLRRRLAPFLLRRTKRTVAKDLPDKIEQVIYCDLSAAQRDAYETFLRKGREKIQQLIETQGFNKARMSILTTLLRLRQTCCHLRLIDAESDARSGKLDALLELVRESIEGGHRVLVFSQFVNMLALIREALDADSIAYAYLDGATPADQRAAQVKAFQGGERFPVFLISLKAGGYGLTLTAADTVIHYDPWWNPAVENQATDRAHRIGQKNPVTAYKLITTGTVEERILALQQKKQSVIDTALDDDAPMMSGLSEQDIREILG